MRDDVVKVRRGEVDGEGAEGLVATHAPFHVQGTACRLARGRAARSMWATIQIWTTWLEDLQPMQFDFAREGDLRGFARVIQPRMRNAFAYAYLMTGSLHDAAYCTQGGVQSARRDVEILKEENADYFLLRYTRREVGKLLQGRRGDLEADQLPATIVGTLEEALEHGDTAHLGRIAMPLLEQLSAEERDAFVVLAVLAVDLETAHDSLGVPREVMVARARRALKTLEATGRVGRSIESGTKRRTSAEQPKTGYGDGSAPVATSDDQEGYNTVNLHPLWQAIGKVLLETAPDPIHTVDEMLELPMLAPPGNASGKGIVDREGRAESPGWRRILGWLLAGALLGLLGGQFILPARSDAKVLHHVRLTHEAPQARTVRVVGDFNGWDPERTPMVRRSATGLWEVWVTVKEGRHRYMFVVDKVTRVPDAQSAENVPDGRGGTVSILHVSDSDSGPAAR